MKKRAFQMLCIAHLIAGASVGISSVQADVTIDQKTNLDVASIIRMHGSSKTNITTDKKREDTESHCEGMMSLVCGNARSGEIVRLDRDLTWHLEPSKKSYREDIFATPEQLAQMRAKMEERLEKMRSCPVSPRQQPIDQSKCQMSPPKIEIHKTDDKMSIAGHDTQHTLATLTETCTNHDTGDVCNTVIAIDLWLTQDKVPGTDDRTAFQQAYAKKLGLADAQGPMRGEFAKFLAPYQSQIKALSDKSDDLKGLPLKTSLRVLMGGQQCSSMSKMKANSSASAGDSSDSDNPMANMAQASKALGSLVGGMFHKKKTDDSQTTDSSTASTPAVGAADPYRQYMQMAAFTMETTAISTDAIPADRFDVPPDWKKEVPKAVKQGDDEFTCPKTGS